MTIQPEWNSLDSRPISPSEAAAGGWTGVKGSRVGPTPRGKRVFDIGFAVLLLIPLSAVMAAVAVVLAVRQGLPLFYRAPRMLGPKQAFTQLKFRTMTLDDADGGASGAHKDWRITPIGRFLRKSRIDELPQLFNILRGDMSFVGPRPPLREYVERYPLDYAEVLQCRPGVTGLATLVYHRHEDRIMAGCETAEATEATYYRRCLPAKFRIERIYRNRRSLRLDLWIIWQTLLTVITNKDVGTRKRARLLARRLRRDQAKGSRG